jgi:hypothetical protein
VKPGGGKSRLESNLTDDAISFEDVKLDVADLVLVGLITAVWQRLEHDVARGLLLEHAGWGQFGDDELKASATDFRRARGLLSASEFITWLSARSLTVADVAGTLGRAIRRQRVAEQPTGAVEDDELAAVLWAEAICSGTLRELAGVAIERVAAAHRLGRLGDDLAGRGAVGTSGFDDPRVRGTVADALGRRAAGLGALGEQELIRRAARLWAYGDARVALRGQVAQPDALRRRLADHGVEWLRLDGWRLRFEGQDAAREARLLIRDDGLDVQQVAELAGATAAVESLYLDQVPAQFSSLLMAVAPGEVAMPWPQDESWNVLLVSDKTPPSTEDPLLRERVTDELLVDLLRREAAGRARVLGAF